MSTNGPVRIGFAGGMGVGKSTAASVLNSILSSKGNNVQILPLAAPLKQFAYMLGWNGNKDEKGRRLLQLLGTDCGRNCISEDIWVGKWVTNIFESANFVIADDVRFENEADEIRKNGFIIHISRVVSEKSDHASEHGIQMKYGDYLIKDNEEIGNLYYLLEGILENVKREQPSLLPDTI